MGSLLLIPDVFFRIADHGTAIIAEFDMGTIAQIIIYCILVRTGFDQTAAVALINQAAVRLLHRLHPVVDGIASVQGRDTVACGVAVALGSAAHIPAVGQGIAQGQYIAILQRILAHAQSRIVHTVQREQPAGAGGVVKLSVGAAGCAALVQAVAVIAPPEGGQASSFSEPCIDGCEYFLLIGAVLIPCRAVQTFTNDARGKALQIEARIQCPRVPGLPAQGILCSTIGLPQIHSEHRLGDGIGDGLVGQHIISDTVHDAQSYHRHVHIDGGRTGFLAGLVPLTLQLDGHFSVVSVGILGVDVEGMLIAVAHIGILRMQDIFRRIAGGADVLYNLAVEGDDQLRIRTVGGDIAHNTAASILSPGTDREVDLRAVDDGLSVPEGGMDLHILLTPMLVGNVDGEGVLGFTAFCCDREGVLAGLAVFQQKHHRILSFQLHRSSGAGLVALNGSDLHALPRRTGQLHLISEESIFQFVIVDGFRRTGLSVFADNRPLLAVLHGVGHLKTHIHGVMHENLELQLLAVHQNRNQHCINILRGPLRQAHRDGSAFLQLSAAAGGGIRDVQDSGVGGILAGQLQLIFHRSGRELIAPHLGFRFSIGHTTQRPGDAALFHPSKGQTHIRRFGVVDDEVKIEDHAVEADLEGHVVFRTGLQHHRAAMGGQLSGISGIRCITAPDDLRLICGTANDSRCIEEHMLRQITAFDRLGGGIIRNAGQAVPAAVLLLPAQFQLQIHTALTVQHEGKARLCALGFALYLKCVCSCTILRQLDGDAPGSCCICPCTVTGFDLNRSHRPALLLTPSKCEIIFQLIVQKLGGIQAFGHRLRRTADNGGLLAAVPVPVHDQSQIEIFHLAALLTLKAILLSFVTVAGVRLGFLRIKGPGFRRPGHLLVVWRCLRGLTFHRFRAGERLRDALIAFTQLQLIHGRQRIIPDWITKLRLG